VKQFVHIGSETGHYETVFKLILSDQPFHLGELLWLTLPNLQKCHIVTGLANPECSPDQEMVSLGGAEVGYVANHDHVSANAK
jgi:hypothetical protein